MGMLWDSTPEFRICQLASTNGDGTGTDRATGDYSVTPEIFYLQPPASETYKITRVIVGIQDAGSLDANSYGNGITLTNGIILRKSNPSGVIRTLTAFPIKTSGDWAKHCHDATPHKYGSGDEILSVRWTFEKSGKPVILRGAKGEKLEFVLNDDFSGLKDHTFIFQGT